MLTLPSGTARVRIVVYIVLGIIAWLLVSRATRPSVDDANYERAVSQALHAGKAYRAQQAKDARTIAALRSKATASVKAADSFHTERQHIVLPVVTPAACEPYSKALSLCVREQQSLRSALAYTDSALTVQSARADRAEVRVGVLDSLLTVRPKPCRVPLVGLVCPKVGVGVFVGPDLKPQLGIGVTIPIL